ncbi:MAG: acyl-CoA thioesterase [Xanthomonadales bacterium]|nr:acyl-CoA thioesterase [Xanthomonadales bacterium]
MASQSQFQQRIDASQTSITKMVFPNTTNNYSTLFGGTLMEWMDEIGFIVATRFSRQKMVTVSMDRIDFKKPIPAGHMVELNGRVSKIGNTSLEVEVEVFKETMYDTRRELAVTGHLTFVAVDDDQKPTPLSVHSG